MTRKVMQGLSFKSLH